MPELNRRQFAAPHGYGRETSLTPGKVDDAACSVFSQGQCHSLAGAISDATGGNFKMAHWRSAAEEDINDHVLAEAPDGRFVDIMGAHEPGDVERTIGVRADDFESFFNPENPSMAEAGQWVEPVLERAGYVAAIRPGWSPEEFEERAVNDLGWERFSSQRA